MSERVIRQTVEELIAERDELAQKLAGVMAGYENALERNRDLVQKGITKHNRIEELQRAIDYALTRLMQRRVFLNAGVTGMAEEELARGEIALIQAMPAGYGRREK